MTSADPEQHAPPDQTGPPEANPRHGDDGHVCTDQETALYDALSAGDPDTVAEIQADARSGDQSPSETPPPRGWRPPAQTVAEDYDNAHRHYQADHEPPEEDRELATALAVEDENTNAPQPE
jgi:hypothetical protein